MNKYNILDILSNEILIEELNETRTYKFMGIQIPMIQRDYAQGRREETEIRKRFLNSIFSALVSGENLELDFVYGSIKEIDKRTFFIPLDGQQRLTTLFLLNWYIGNRELRDIELERLRSNVAKFTYETRVSAREFCEKLSKVSLSFKGKPSIELSNASWFYDLYKKDPTVSAMLIMLDAIHEKYQEINKQLFPALSKLTFYILPLDGFNLSDELYIKMNARGKQLTDYENFKADLTNWLQDIKNPLKNEFLEEVVVNERKMPYHFAFSLKLDNEWTNLFWNYTKGNDKSSDKLVDPYFFRFWNRYLLNKFIIQSNIAQEAVEREELFKRFYGNEESFKYESFDYYKSSFESDSFVKNAQVLLDRLSSHYQEIQDLIKPAWSNKDKWILFDTGITQPQRILLLAVCLYLERNEFDSIKFGNWIRVVWNIIIDPDIRSIAAMVSVMRIINKLSIGSGDIYSFLIGNGCLTLIQNEKSFAKSQIAEERQKALLIKTNPSWEEELITAERHLLFKGNISFLLLGNPDIAKFKQRSDIAKDLFSEKGSKGLFNNNHILMRAVISQFENWDDLYKLNLGDNADNWELLLRRNPTTQLIISRLCDFVDSNKVLSEVNTYLKIKSNINGWGIDSAIEAKAKHIHEQIYQNRDLHKWMQANGAVNLKWSNNHVYIYRPRSWYNWVLLDVYRNEIITELIAKFNLTTTQQCDTSNYYWGTKIELTRLYTDFIVSVEFDNAANMIIGIKDDGKSKISAKVVFSTSEIQDGWLCRKTYGYDAVTAISPLIKRIEQEFFDEQNSNSMIFKIINS